MKMKQVCVFLLILCFLTCTKGNSHNFFNLQIIKCADNIFTPVSSSIMEEKAGTNFSLFCDLVSSYPDRDYQISSMKHSSELRFWRQLSISNTKKTYIVQSSEMEKPIKRFEPLKAEDQGKYMCVSLKYNLIKSIEVVVLHDKPQEERIYFQDTYTCSDSMFQCANGVCIIQHYICDGKPDCTDGSDERVDTCNGDPCKDKLQCDDGRCIPLIWCCDWRHDPNCTVRNRPTCCQVLSDSYEDSEYRSPKIAQNHNGARYLFITICTLCTLFVILLFFVLVSRVVLMARKTDLGRATPSPPCPTIENISLTSQGPLFNCDVYTYRPTSEDTQTECDVSDPLLFEEEQPPSYLDVIRGQGDGCSGINEPPPPYTSREVLNEVRSEAI